MPFFAPVKLARTPLPPALVAAAAAIERLSAAAITSLPAEMRLFSQIFLGSIPSLSRQMLGVKYKTAQKKGRFPAPRGLTMCIGQSVTAVLNTPCRLSLCMRTLRENGTFFEFSLCLSRACLGKRMHFIYKWRKKCRFLTYDHASRPLRLLRPATAPQQSRHRIARYRRGCLFPKRVFSNEFLPRLSRACLGKMIIVVHLCEQTWTKKRPAFF